MPWTPPTLQLEHGERHGQLTVLKRVATKQGTKYICGCACGRQEHFRAGALTRGSATRCRRCARASA